MSITTAVRQMLGDPPPTIEITGKTGADAQGIPQQAGMGTVGPPGDASQVTPTDTYGNVKCAVPPTNGKQGNDGLTGQLGNEPENGQACPSQIYNLGRLTGTIIIKVGGGNGGIGGKGGQGGRGGPGGPAGALATPCSPAAQGPGGRGGKGGRGHDGGHGGDTGNIVITLYTGSPGSVAKIIPQGIGGNPGDPGDPGPVGDGGPGTDPNSNLGPGDSGVRGGDGAAGSVTVNYIPPPTS